MTSGSDIQRRRSVSRRQADAIESQSEQVVVPYDENLLERARVQWQFGDWESLAAIDRDTLQHHPDRAKLALLAAAGLFQTGDTELARHFIRLARDWGCNSKLLSQIIAAGVHNSLARATANVGNYLRAFKHFESAVRLGAAGTDIRLMLQARTNEQFAQLGLQLPENPKPVLDQKAKPDVLESFSGLQNEHGPFDIASIFFSEQDGDHSASLGELKKALASESPSLELPEVAWSFAEHRNKAYVFAHFSGDYIPAKMAEKKQFYESPFLNLLARLHQPGKLIVDGGANIGNHTVFFAGVIGAPVIAFEPQPFNHGFLLANVFLNHLAQKVDAREIALGEQAGNVSLRQALPGNYGSFTADMALVKPPNVDTHPATAFDVPVSTLDAELAGYDDAVSIIKLDLEGMELHALRGATNIIAKSLPVIAVECFTRSIFQNIKEFLAVFDYFVIDSTNATPTFIFLTRRNPHHLEMLSKYLEMSSVGKFSANSSFNEVG